MMKNTNIQNTNIKSIAFVPAMMASFGVDSLMDQFLYLLDPATWFFVIMWLVMLAGMILKYLSLIPSAIGSFIAYIPNLTNALTSIC